MAVTCYTDLPLRIEISAHIFSVSRTKNSQFRSRGTHESLRLQRKNRTKSKASIGFDMTNRIKTLIVEHRILFLPFRHSQKSLKKTLHPEPPTKESKSTIFFERFPVIKREKKATLLPCVGMLN